MRLPKSEFVKYSKELVGDYAIKFLSGVNEKNLYPHYHECFEMLFMVEGKVAYRTSQGLFMLRPGDIMFHNVHAQHSPLILNKEALYERINLQIKPEKLKSLSGYGIDLSRCFTAGNSGIFRIPYYAQNTIRMILGKIITVYEEKPFGYKLLEDIYLTELFLKISEFFYAKSSEETIKELQPLQLLNMVDQFIAENIDCPICIDDLANFVCMNKYSFMRCFKELASCTAYQYIINTRLKEAEALIKAGTPFTNAAEKCGFSDYSCFYRCFHNKYKMSPQKYFEGYVQSASSANGKETAR